VLITAFGKNSKFEIVERARVADLLNEKKLAMTDLVQTDRVAFESRGISHLLNGTMKVYDEVRVLSYQIINVKTGLPVASEIIEWSDEKELKGAMSSVAKQCEEQVFNVNGKLVIEKCDLEDVRVFMEKKEAGSTVEELGFCPLTVEDIPKGNYTLLFKHEERDTLSMDIVIVPQETNRIPLVKMPPIDMTAFNEACSLEISARHAEAIEKFKEFYRKYPKHRLSHYAMYREGFIAQIYQKKYVEGRKILEEVIKRNPDAGTRTEAYYGIALGYQVEGQMDKSREILKMLINEYPASTAAEQAQDCLDKGKCSL
jgi:TolA-binding protein